MFYQKEMDKSLRFGDVLRGYISTDVIIKEPILSMKSESHDYKIGIELPDLSVVLTPCCSIGDHTITLAPLIKLRSDFFKNPHFVKDFTIINRKMDPEISLSSDDWGKLSLERKENLRKEGESYTLLELFIYEKNDLFPEYKIRGQEINYYMMDFRKTYTIKCDLIKRPEETREDSIILQTKCLQLSIQARSELRDKLAYYFARVPKEDKVQED